MTDPTSLYRDLLLALPANYTAAGMVKDFRITFGTDQGKRVLAMIMGAAGWLRAYPELSDADLRATEGKRALVLYILDMATSDAQPDGTAVSLAQKIEQQTEVNDG